MATHPQRIFDFAQHLPQRDEIVELIKQFAGQHPFRSAEVEELELDEDFYRRPVRPEDLAFIGFRKAVSAKTVTRLPFLAANRLLLSINELKVARLPRDNEPETIDSYRQFYGEQNQMLGSRIRPYLENFAFNFLCDVPVEATGAADIAAQLQDLLQTEAGFWGGMLELLVKADYLEEGLRFALIQNWSLAPSKRYALGAAAATGYFDLLPAAARPQLSPEAPGDRTLHRLAMRCGVTKREHSYWQFYLSSSLASCNFLHALASRPDKALALYGAAFAAEAQWLGFGCLVGQAAARLGVESDAGLNQATGAALENLGIRFARLLEAVAERYGDDGLQQVAAGLSAARVLAACARTDIGDQLRWLSAVETYRGYAHAIDRRIQAERPDIDRETFVEPREMCSTTHVHNDHRLVVIESGKMVFWGNLGMALHLEPGEMVLVPEGRLHGSTIESEECTYHQPIIPDDWIQSLLDGAAPDEAVPAAVAR
jgi:hypothetical protein